MQNYLPSPIQASTEALEEITDTFCQTVSL